MKREINIEALADSSYIYVHGEEDIYRDYILDMVKETEDIKEVNGLDGEELPVGKPILIVKNMEIFK